MVSSGVVVASLLIVEGIIRYRRPSAGIDESDTWGWSFRLFGGIRPALAKGAAFFRDRARQPRKSDSRNGLSTERRECSRSRAADRLRVAVTSSNWLMV
jgi:hypothetical protein